MNALIEPFFLCLLASMIWAPVIFLAAQRYRHDDAHADKIWPAALLLAALPALLAPLAAAFGLSLRAAPPPLPPMGEPATTSVPFPITAETVAPTPASAITAQSLFEAVAALYVYGFLMFLALGVMRHIWFAYRVRYATDMEEPRLEAAFEAWRRRLNVSRKPRYAFTDAVSSVCVHGVFRPVVLMPDALLERVKEDDVILMVAHEMAHIKRGDTALFAFCTVVKSVFWFNPFMQRMAAQANLAAEQAADALVIARGAERRQYAHCFIQGLRFAAGSQFAGRELVPSFTPFDRRSRRERLDAILSGKSKAALSIQAKAGLALSIAAAGGLAFAQAALAVAPPPAKDALTHAPVEGKVTAVFTQRSVNIDAKEKAHRGIDIKAPRGTAVRAAGDGKVIDATSRYRGQSAWGKVVVIDHGHGLVTRYAHLDDYVVRKGDSVKAGDAIGSVGSTGKSTKAHLHFEVIRDGLPIDPMPVIASEPMPAPDPVAAPKPAPSKTPAPASAPKRYAIVAPNGKVLNFTAPDSAPEPETPPAAASASYAEFAEAMVAGLETRVTETVKKIENLSEFQDLKTLDFDFQNMDRLPDMNAMTLSIAGSFSDMELLNEESRAAIQNAQDNIVETALLATHDIQQDLKDINEDLQRAREKAERDRERAELDRKRAQKDRERAEQDRERAERDRERAERDAERAREQAERERERAQQEAERAREEAERSRERAQALRERERERAEREAERAREQAEREFERAIQQAEARAERELERAEREWAKQHKNKQVINKRETLALREKAVKEARRDLDRELAEIERLRAELDRTEANSQK